MDKYEVSLKAFNDEIRDFTKKMIPAEIVKLQTKIVLEALRRVVMRTPVDTGRARGNWHVTINRRSDHVNAALRDPDGSKTIADGYAAIKDLPPFSTVWITNNLEYIEFLEHGSSKQAPEGMVALTVDELRQMFDLKG
ncbi:MAG: HK97 gp10 family phage protein [Phycisphaerae bacterium]|nr:HK97 gp10 family phage protein [Phycisphaerae bacterium]